MIAWLLKKVENIYGRILYWKWDMESAAAARRFQGCQHERTVFVDVGTVVEKCCECWALRLPKLGTTANEEDRPPAGAMAWYPNCARPERAIRADRVVCDGFYAGDGCGWSGFSAELRPSGCCPTCGGGHIKTEMSS